MREQAIVDIARGIEHRIEEINNNLMKYKIGSIGWILAATSWNNLVDECNRLNINLTYCDGILEKLIGNNAEGDEEVRYIVIPVYDNSIQIFQDDGKGIETESCKGRIKWNGIV